VATALIAQAQVQLQGTVNDAANGEALPWCSISVKGTGKGTVANSEGIFVLTVRVNRDTLVFSYVGYRSLEVPATRLLHDLKVLMEKAGIQLEEVVVHADDDYLYEIVEKCRKKILKDNQVHFAKVYYGIETLTREQPIEQVECYYNGYLNGISVDSLLFRNGRIGCAELDQRYFLTLNSSMAVSQLNLVWKDQRYPSVPLQLTGKILKKAFHLTMEPGDRNLYRIGFQPRKEPRKNFAGSIWIDRRSFDIVKIDLVVENAINHPFSPIYRADRLSEVSISISETYKLNGDFNVPDYMNFTYAFNYLTNRGNQENGNRDSISRRITTHGLLCMYDYDSPFIRPYFTCDPGFDDYRKMSVIPYNPVFWENNRTMVLTERQKQNLGFFASKGLLMNFGEGKYGRDFLTQVHYDSTLYENYYTFWDSSRRLSLNRHLPQNRPYSATKVNGQILSNLYHFEVQLLLDVTGVADSFNCRSYAVFDEKRSLFHLPVDKYTGTFINLYFDLYEIERRKMQQTLDSRRWTALQIDSVYRATVKSAGSAARRYLDEVKSGKNIHGLKRWNDNIKEQLGVDNFVSEHTR